MHYFFYHRYFRKLELRFRDIWDNILLGLFGFDDDIGCSLGRFTIEVDLDLGGGKQLLPAGQVAQDGPQTEEQA